MSEKLHLQQLKGMQSSKLGISERGFQQGGGGEETRSGTERRCSHNLQGGYPAWSSADSCTFSNSK